jgi:Uma2 family endonuclease
MNILQQPVWTEAPPRQRLVLNGITWEGYVKLSDLLGKLVRINYDRGLLEIMTTYSPHELLKTVIGMLLGVVAEEFLIPMKCVGSTTLRRQDVDKGLEPDLIYYLASMSRVRDWRKLDLNVDPPPDLCVEIEISRSVVDRLRIYAGLGIPELWRCDGQTLEAWRLRPDGQYERCPHSPSLPFVPLDEVLSLVGQHLDSGDDGAWLRVVRAWVRQRLGPLWEAAGRPGAPGA